MIQHKNTLLSALGIEIQHMDPELVRGTMPVDERTIQPFDYLHGGASLALAESLASIGANLHVNEKEKAVGLEINANHIRSVAKGAGPVTGEARPLHLGGKTQVWQIEIKNPQGKIVCISRCTLAIVPR